MRLSIADLYIDIECENVGIGNMPNLKPFVVLDDEAKTNPVICRIQTGQTISIEKSMPALSQMSNGKMLRLWLFPDFCKLSLSTCGNDKVYWLETDRQWKIVRTNWSPIMTDSVDIFNDIVMIAFIYSSAFYHTVTIHASCVAIKNNGCMFVGPSGIGKSTHSCLWLHYIPETRLLNDDQPIVRLLSGETVRVYGSPWSGKTPCYHNEGVGLKSLFFMEQALENYIARLNGIETFQKLMRAASLIGRDTFSFEPISGTLAKIAGMIPAFQFKNRPEKEAAELSYRSFIQLLDLNFHLP